MKYWDNISALAEAQRIKGLEHYGRSLEENLDLNDPVQIIDEAMAESVDNLMYLEHSKRFIKNASEFINEMKQFVFSESATDADAEIICRKLLKYGFIKVNDNGNYEVWYYGGEDE